jgi:hypothetical protein
MMRAEVPMRLTIPNVDWSQFTDLLLSDAHVAQVVAAVAVATGRRVTERAVYAARAKARSAARYAEGDSER